MASLGSVILNIFHNSDSNSQIRRSRGRGVAQTPITTKRYMEIPIDADVFELPLLAFDSFMKMHLTRKDSNMIVASLYCCGQTSSYKSFDSVIKDVLSTSFSSHLSKVQVAGSNNTYYATFGAVFDEAFKPLMMLSWLLERKADGEGVIKYHYKRPLLRLNPYPCVSKEDSLQRFIAGKMLTTSLDTVIYTPYFYDCGSFIDQSQAYSVRDNFHIKVEIDECPFVIRGTDTPSISATNEGLLQLAANHVDEILQ